MVLDSLLNPVFGPLLELGPFWAIFILSLIISLLIVLVYKYATNQEEMKRLKDQQKDFQKKMKELKENPAEMMKIQKEAMQSNLQYMKHSFKATLITMLPILLIFGWMNGHLMYEPIYPGEKFTMTAGFADGVTGEAEIIVDEGVEILSEVKQQIQSQVTWRMKSSGGEHYLKVKTSEGEEEIKVLITKEFKYENPISFFEDSDIKSLQVNYEKLKPLGTFSIFGWEPGWLGLYIILSIVFSMGLRKVLKVY